MTRDESLEAQLLVQYVALVIGALLLARLAHVGAAHLLLSLKPPLAPGEYVHLLVVFLPIWVFAAERLGIHRIHVVTGPAYGAGAPADPHPGLGPGGRRVDFGRRSDLAQPFADRHLLSPVDDAAARRQLVAAPLRGPPSWRVAGAGHRRGRRRGARRDRAGARTARGPLSLRGCRGARGAAARQLRSTRSCCRSRCRRTTRAAWSS